MVLFQQSNITSYFFPSYFCHYVHPEDHSPRQQKRRQNYITEQNALIGTSNQDTNLMSFSFPNEQAKKSTQSSYKFRGEKRKR